MTTKPTKPSLREENRRHTEQRILDAAIGLAEERQVVDFTMPEVAERSGVALRTLYRHFPTRRHLVDALARIADQVDALPPPASLDELEAWMVRAWANLLEIEPFLRAQHEGAEGDAIRRRRTPGHRATTAALIRSIRPDLDDQTQADLVDQVLLLGSSTAMFEFIDVIGVDGERAARLAARAIVTLVRNA